MSRYKLRNCTSGYSVVCGWDSPLQTFFVQVEKPDGTEIWRGMEFGEIREVSELQKILEGVATIPVELAERLQFEKNAASGWTAKVFNKEDIVAVLLAARETKNAEHQTVIALHEKLKSKQRDKAISTAEGIILELLELCDADKRVGENRDPFGENNRGYTRNLGEQANRLGGMEMMQNIYYCIYPQDRRDLERVWNGIGDWLS
jgi:hypothetical protein